MDENRQQILKNWVKEYTDTLYSWAFHKTSSNETAEDLVQETFLSAFTSFHKFQNKSNPKTWLFSILNHKIIDFYRKKSSSLLQLNEQKADKIASDFYDENDMRLPSDAHSLWDSDNHLLDNPDFLATLKNCMDSLPEKWGLAITQKYLLEKKAEEICQELELTSSNYWQVIHRAKLLLKKCIEKNWKI